MSISKNNQVGVLYEQIAISYDDAGTPEKYQFLNTAAQYDALYTTLIEVQHGFHLTNRYVYHGIS